MVGGRQRQSRKNELRNLLGDKITLKVSDGHETIEGKCILEFRDPDKGYFIQGTSAQIPLSTLVSGFDAPYKIYSQDGQQQKTVLIDLSRTLIQSLIKYEEALI